MLRARIAAALLAAAAVASVASVARSQTPVPTDAPIVAPTDKVAIPKAIAPKPIVPKATPADAAVSATLASQIGSWNCAITIAEVKDRQRVLVNWSAYGTNWIHGFADVPAYGGRPDHRADFAFGYDFSQKMWVSVYTDSLGAYSISKSDAPPSAKKMTFTDAFPIDPHDGPSIVTLGAQTATIDSAWQTAGVSHTSHERCDKV
jgi:hypothetical protein